MFLKKLKFIVLFSGSLLEISITPTRKMLGWNFLWTPCQKLCPSSRGIIQEINEKEDSEERKQ